MRKFDLFPKLDKQYRVGTNLGGILSIVSIITTIFLVFFEIWIYCHPTQRQRLIVNTAKPSGIDGRKLFASKQDRLDIHFNITFPKIPCYLMHFDVIDPITNAPMQIEDVHSKFLRIDKNGKSLEKNFNEKDFYSIGKDSNKETSCYIEGVSDKCNSCLDVLNAHKKYNKHMPLLRNIKQCEEVQKSIDQTTEEGCSISANFKALKIQSEFHVSPGFSEDNQGYYINDVSAFGLKFSDINLSHTINYIKFNNIDSVFPLDNYVNVQKEKRAFRYVYNADILDNNFTATEYTIADPLDYTPGVIFKYDISPISGQTYSDREPFLHLCTRLLTVVGGVLGAIRAMDKMLFSVRTRISDEIIQPETNVK